MSHDHAPQQENGGRPNYLGLEIPYGTLYIVMATVVAVTIIFALLMMPLVRGAVFLDEEKATVAPALDAARTNRPSGPLLQAKPEDDMDAFRASEDSLINSYGFVDRSAGIARIPLQEAKDLVLRDGVSPLPPSSGDETE